MWLGTLLSISLSLVARTQGLFEKVWQMDTCGPPQIQNTMMNQTKYPGESAFFRCQIDMSKCMVSFIDWYLLRINASEREKIKSARHGDPHTHTIENVDLDHEGLYTCVVGNVLGQAEASAYLSVQSGSSTTSLQAPDIPRLCMLVWVPWVLNMNGLPWLALLARSLM